MIRRAANRPNHGYLTCQEHTYYKPRFGFQDGSKVETMTKGANELLSLKEILKGVVELEISDRLALDTRVR